MLPVLVAALALLCTSPAALEIVANQTETNLVPDALLIEDPVTSNPGYNLDSNLDDEDDEPTTPSQETQETTDTSEIPEALPVAQPLVMDLSLEDVDYMTVLRPPPPPMPPGLRPGPRVRKKKQKRRRRPEPVPVNQVPVNPLPEVQYHRGYPDYAEDEQRKSRERTQEEYSLQHVDEVEMPFAFESVMRHVASLGQPHYHNHKSFGVDAPPSDNNVENSQHFTPIAQGPPQQHQHQPHPLNQPLQPPIQHSRHTQHSQHSPHSHDLYHSATVQVTRSVPIGEHHSSTSGDWLIGFNPTGTAVSPVSSKPISENTIEPLSKSPPFSGDTMGMGTMTSSNAQPTSPPPASPPPASPASMSTSATPASTVEPNAKRATLRDILSTDCPDAEEQGYCDSPPRYPTQQVNAVLRQCADLVELLHAPLPDVPDDDPTTVPGEEPVCPFTRQILRPGYVRDAASGRWFVAVQSRGRVSQLIPSEKCNAAGRSCARLADSKCARNIGFRNGVRASACRQKWTMRSVLTWDPDRPARCPQITMVKLPNTCVCRLLPGSEDSTNKSER